MPTHAFKCRVLISNGQVHELTKLKCDRTHRRNRPGATSLRVQSTPVSSQRVFLTTEHAQSRMTRCATMFGRSLCHARASATDLMHKQCSSSVKSCSSFLRSIAESHFFSRPHDRMRQQRQIPSIWSSSPFSAKCSTSAIIDQMLPRVRSRVRCSVESETDTAFSFSKSMTTSPLLPNC
jgi:hypothetical protein